MYAMRSAHAGGPGFGTLQDVTGTIRQVEGARSSLNNPGNLTYAGQAGATPSSYSFVGPDGRTYYLAQFDDLATGEAALDAQVLRDAARGKTILAFAKDYAPSGNGNNPEAYAQYIASATGLSINDPLSLAIADRASSSDSAGDINDGEDQSSNFDFTGAALAAAAGLVLFLWFQKS